jgi:hypothetical protein
VGAAAHRGLDAVGNPSVRQQAESLEAQRPASAIAEQALATFGITGRHRHGGVNVEAASGHVEVEATAEALGKADSAASKPSRARACGQPCVRLLVLPAQDGLNEDAPDRAQGSSVLRQE